MIFISRETSHQNVKRILDAARDKEILTIGDYKKLAYLGGVIGLIEKEGKLRFEINLESARRQKLRLSSRLLDLAIIVEEP